MKKHYAAFTKTRNAEIVKKYLLKHELLDTNYKILKEFDFIYFPLLKKAKVPRAKVVSPKFKFEQRNSKPTIDKLLSSILTSKQKKLLPRSQEIVGSIMILEIPDELRSKEKEIAKAYLQITSNVDTVVKKMRMHKGVFRTRKVKILAGKKTKETTHIESGVKLKLHLEKTYFSARSGNERLRLAKQIKNNENVLVMFSGCGPFPLVFAKHSKARHITGIELNPDAHNYAIGNMQLNKIHNLTLISGDVNVVMPKLRKKYDRIAMPLPKTGEEYLGLALKKGVNDGIIHLYAFLHDTEINRFSKKIRDECTKWGYSIRILRKVTCGQFSPGVFRMCFDIKIKKRNK